MDFIKTKTESILNYSVYRFYENIENQINLDKSNTTTHVPDRTYNHLFYSKKNQFKIILLRCSKPLVELIDSIAKTIIHFIGSPFSKRCSCSKGLDRLSYVIVSIFMIPAKLVFCPLDLFFTCFGKGTLSGQQLQYKLTIKK